MPNPFSFITPSQLVTYLRKQRPDSEGFYSFKVGNETFRIKPPTPSYDRRNQGLFIIEGGSSENRKYLASYMRDLYKGIDILQNLGKISEDDASYLLHNWLGYLDSFDYRSQRGRPFISEKDDASSWKRVSDMHAEADRETRKALLRLRLYRQQRSRQTYTGPLSFTTVPKSGTGAMQDRYIYNSNDGRWYAPSKSDNLGEVDWRGRGNHPSLPRGVPSVERNTGLYIYDASTGYYQEYNPSTISSSRKSSTRSKKHQVRLSSSLPVQQVRLPSNLPVQQVRAGRLRILRTSLLPDSQSTQQPDTQVIQVLQTPIVKPYNTPSVKIKDNHRYTYGLGKDSDYTKVYTNTPITGYTYDDDGNIYYNGVLQSYKIGGRLPLKKYRVKVCPTTSR